IVDAVLDRDPVRPCGEVGEDLLLHLLRRQELVPPGQARGGRALIGVLRGGTAAHHRHGTAGKDTSQQRSSIQPHALVPFFGNPADAVGTGKKPGCCNHWCRSWAPLWPGSSRSNAVTCPTARARSPRHASSWARTKAASRCPSTT